MKKLTEQQCEGQSLSLYKPCRLTSVCGNGVKWAGNIVRNEAELRDDVAHTDQSQRTIESLQEGKRFTESVFIPAKMDHYFSSYVL